MRRIAAPVLPCLLGPLLGLALAWAEGPPHPSPGMYLACGLTGLVAGLVVGITFAVIGSSRARSTVGGRRDPGAERSAAASPSEVAASFRAIREDVIRRLGGDDALAGRIVCVTSSGAGEGKTTALLDLAASFAASGRRCVVVDLCVRKPCLHELLEVPRSPGIAEYLRGEASGAEATRETRYPGLLVIPAGTGPWPMAAAVAHRTVDLLGVLVSGRMAWLEVDDLARARDLVPLVDLVIMVARIGVTDKHEFALACALLSEHGPGKVLLIANDVPLESAGRGAARWPEWVTNQASGRPGMPQACGTHGVPGEPLNCWNAGHADPAADTGRARHLRGGRALGKCLRPHTGRMVEESGGAHGVPGCLGRLRYAGRKLFLAARSV